MCNGSWPCPSAASVWRSDSTPHPEPAEGSTQRKTPRGKYDDDLLTADIVALAQQDGRYGHRRITALLRDAGWVVNAKRVDPSTGSG